MDWREIGVKAIIAAAIAAWSQVDGLAQALFLLQVLDIAAGLGVAVNQRNVSVRKSFRGMSRKAMMWIVWGMTAILQMYANAYIQQYVPVPDIPISDVVALYYITTEAISILANASEMGLPVPEFLKQMLARMQPRQGETNDNAGR